MKTFKQILEAAQITIMINGPEKAVMKLIKKHKGKVEDVTDKGSAIVKMPAKNFDALKRDMWGLGSKGYDLAVSKDNSDQFDTVMV